MPFDGITSRNAALTSGYFGTRGKMSSAYYRQSSRNSWQDAVPGLSRPSGTDQLRTRRTELAHELLNIKEGVRRKGRDRALHGWQVTQPTDNRRARGYL